MGKQKEGELNGEGCHISIIKESVKRIRDVYCGEDKTQKDAVFKYLQGCHVKE